MGIWYRPVQGMKAIKYGDLGGLGISRAVLKIRHRKLMPAHVSDQGLYRS